MPFVAIAQACHSCGGRTAVAVSTARPIQGDLTALTESLGGMYCIRVAVCEVEIDGEIVRADDLTRDE